MSWLARHGSATFRARLAWNMTALAVAALAAAGALIYLGVRRTLVSQLDAALLTIARTELASAFDEPGKPVHVHEELPVPLTLPIGSGYEKFARIATQDGRVIAQTSNLGIGPPLLDAPDLVRQAVAGEVMFGDLWRDGTIFRGVYYPVTDPSGARLVALVAVPKEPVMDALHAVLGALAVALAGAAVVAGFGARRIARHLTRPLEQIASAAGAIGAVGRQGRIPEGSADVELRVLTRVLNEMLGRLEDALAAERQALAAQQRFVADASHELRSPLANLRGTIEVALRRPRSTEEYRETLESAAREIERLSRLAHDLLMLSRLDAGRQSYRFRQGDAAQIAAEAAAACATRAAEKGVELELDTTAPVQLVCDPDRIRQVVDNLLDNALRHAPDQSRVSVCTRTSNAHVEIRVADQGPGLAPADAARVFDRFYRVDSARGRDSGGLGLGLTIARAIVAAHGGTLSVESAPGAGCTFRARLPAQGPALPPVSGTEA